MCLRADRSTAQLPSYALLATRIGHERAACAPDPGSPAGPPPCASFPLCPVGKRTGPSLKDMRAPRTSYRKARCTPRTPRTLARGAPRGTSDRTRCRRAQETLPTGSCLAGLRDVVLPAVDLRDPPFACLPTPV